MTDLFQKHKLLFAIGFFILIVIIVLTSYSQSRTEVSESTAEVPDHDLSTPELIDQALARGEITEEEHLLYFAYAVHEYESLPTRFRSNVGWDGTPILEVIRETVTSPGVFCSMSRHVRSEFQRLFNMEMTCE